MAEIVGVISLVSGLIAISEAGINISKSLYNLGESLLKAKSQISELAAELSTISTVFGSLAEVLENSGSLLKPSLLKTTHGILADCQETYVEIEHNVDLVQGRAMRARDRAQWVFRKAKVKQLRTRLESAKASLHLMVSILELSAGLKFLQQQDRFSENIAEIQELVRQRMEESTESVIKVQLALDKAEACEKRLAEKDSELNGSSFVQKSDTSMALVKLWPIHDFMTDLPGLQEMTPIYFSRVDGSEQHGNVQSITRFRELEKEALAIVKQLYNCWTNVGDADHGRSLEDFSLGMSDENETRQTAKHVDSKQPMEERFVHYVKTKGYSDDDQTNEPVLKPDLFSDSPQSSRASSQSISLESPTKPEQTDTAIPRLRATEEDAIRAGIPRGYSIKNWDPTMVPVVLLGSVFDPDSLGKWIYDWTVFQYGACTPIGDTAGDLWLLLIKLAGKVKKADECLSRIHSEESREMVESFVETGERLWPRFKKLLKACEFYMWKAAKIEGSAVILGHNSGCEFVDSMFGRDRELKTTEKLMHSIRVWNMRFDANCEDILKPL